MTSSRYGSHVDFGEGLLPFSTGLDVDSGENAVDFGEHANNRINARLRDGLGWNIEWRPNRRGRERGLRGPHNGGPEHPLSAESNRPPIDAYRLEYEHLADHPRQPRADFGGSRASAIVSGCFDLKRESPSQSVMAST
jgi:hypothetical protein